MAFASEQPLLHQGDNISNCSTRTWAERWLSSERLAPYLADCEGDIDRALALYEWNVALGQVLMRDIFHFEVALRNAYDRVMCEGWHGDAHWLLDDASPARRPVMRRSKRGELDANRINRKAIDAVIGRLPSGATSGSVVSNLTLGFWVHLSDRSREAVIWRTFLYRAWPKGTDRRNLQPRAWTVFFACATGSLMLSACLIHKMEGHRRSLRMKMPLHYCALFVRRLQSGCMGTSRPL